MRVLKFIGWTLMILIVLSVIFIVAMGVFGSSEDDLAVISLQNSSLKIEKDHFQLLSFPLTSDTDEQKLSEFFSADNGLDKLDFITFQNVDENGDGFDQKTCLNGKFDTYNSWYSHTKTVLFSLLPLDKIRFKIHSGSLSFSRYEAASAVKRLLPSTVNQTLSYVTVTPSLQVLEFKTADRSELYIINLDNVPVQETTNAQSVFLAYIKEELIEKLAEDAHIIITGNWDYELPGMLEEKRTEPIPLDWTLSGWQWLYNEADSRTYGMLLSENITIDDVEYFEGLPQNPFKVTFSLN